MTTLCLSCWWLISEPFLARLGLAVPIDPVRSEFWLAKGFASLDSDRPEEAEAALQHSLALSPMNARAWYGYALATARFDWLNRTSSRALKMSYYTGFNQSDLVEGRLLLLVRADTRADPELELLLRRQIRSLILRAPALEQLLDRTYFAATEKNREIISSELRQAGRAPPGQQK